jgi:branched-chain amino acid transport system ATP-binding protein
MTPLLAISDLHVAYKAVPALSGVSIDLFEGEILVILGANGAGKTTIVKSILGLTDIQRGSISLRTDGTTHDLRKLKTHEIHRLGVTWVPEGRQLWGTMTVLDNLKMGGFAADPAETRERIEEMLDWFPRLRERQHQLAGSLSGGEQQMVALARALIARPKLVLMDELSLGLAPLVVAEVFQLVKKVNALGVSVLLVEQNARQALRIATRAYLLEVGHVVESGLASELANKRSVQDIFLGGHS